jgi:hypothetical protein
VTGAFVRRPRSAFAGEMQFSWIVLLLGVLGLLVVLGADWATSAPVGETGRGHHHLRWYSPLPLLAWLAALAVAAYPALTS